MVGTGQQGSDLEGGKVGVEQEISSPWDVCVAGLPGKQLEVLECTDRVICREGNTD